MYSVAIFRNPRYTKIQAPTFYAGELSEAIHAFSLAPP